MQWHWLWYISNNMILFRYLKMLGKPESPMVITVSSLIKITIHWETMTPCYPCLNKNHFCLYTSLQKTNWHSCAKKNMHSMPNTFWIAFQMPSWSLLVIFVPLYCSLLVSILWYPNDASILSGLIIITFSHRFSSNKSMATRMWEPQKIQIGW